MLELVPDADIEGHFRVLKAIMRSSAWSDFWTLLECQSTTFSALGLPRNSNDEAVWKTVALRDAILVTGNRNNDGPTSLEEMIRRPESLLAMPVMTISEPNAVFRSKVYANKVVESLYEHLIDIENRRGTGRLYLP